MEISAKTIKELREATGAGVLDCRKALEQTGGDMDKAKAWLKDKGLASAAKKADRVAKDGLIGSYIHHNNRVAVLIEVNCETDFVARGEDFQRFVKDLAMHICASEPQFVSKEEVSADVIEKEKEIARGQAMADPKNANKPEQIIEKMIQGRLDKFFTEAVLLEQPFVKDQTVTIAELVTQLTAKTGEKCSIRRFARYKMGEGLEKRADDFASEVAAMTK